MTEWMVVEVVGKDKMTRKNRVIDCLASSVLDFSTYVTAMENMLVADI
jgi:hypothetical protein